MPEPELYRRAALCTSDADGNQHIAKRCPVALSASESSTKSAARRRGIFTRTDTACGLSRTLEKRSGLLYSSLRSARSTSLRHA